jgi:hypothetical protein
MKSNGEEQWYPDEWYNNERLPQSAKDFSILCFKRPDYEAFPSDVLKDENLFERLLLSMRDLSQAKSAIRFLEGEVDWDESYSLTDLRRFQAYETSLITSYSRPFSMTTPGIPRLTFEKLGIKLSSFTEGIHQDILNKRNKIFAHSDVDAIDYTAPVIMKMERYDGSEYTSLFPPRFKEGLFLSRADVARIDVLISCLFGAVMDMTQAMHSNFPHKYNVIDMTP